MPAVRSKEPPNPRARFIAVGKGLFARHGYEQTPISTIAREAETSESQLVRYFGGKAGLLEAIFDEGWRSLNDQIQRLVADAPDSCTAILGILTAILTAFRRDPDLARVFLFEGRRVRGEHGEIILSTGFRKFADMLTRLIRRGQQDGGIAKALDAAAVASALMGAAEGMLRDSLLATHGRKPAPYSERSIQRVFTAIVESLGAAPPARINAGLRRPTGFARDRTRASASARRR